MIVNQDDASKHICPILSCRGDGYIKCVGPLCMAWRPYSDGAGMCGLCNPARDCGTPDEKQIKSAIQSRVTSHPSS